MIRHFVFPGVSSSGATSCCSPLHMTDDTIAPTLHLTHRRLIQCWRLHGQNLTVSFFETVGWTAALASVHLVLLLQIWRVSVLLPSNGPSVHLTLLTSLLLLWNSSSTSTKWIVGSSDGACWFQPLRSVPSAPTLTSRVLSVHPTMSFLCFFILTLLNIP
jgi:hypothetical protein